jgi:hypothetical protein
MMNVVFVEGLSLKMKNILLPGLLLRLCWRRTEDEGLRGIELQNVQECNKSFIEIQKPAT